MSRLFVQSRVNVVHGEPGGKAMPEVMEAEVFDAGTVRAFAKGGSPGFPRLVVPRNEHKVFRRRSRSFKIRSKAWKTSSVRLPAASFGTLQQALRNRMFARPLMDVSRPNSVSPLRMK